MRARGGRARERVRERGRDRERKGEIERGERETEIYRRAMRMAHSLARSLAPGMSRVSYRAYPFSAAAAAAAAQLRSDGGQRLAGKTQDEAHMKDTPRRCVTGPGVR